MSDGQADLLEACGPSLLLLELETLGSSCSGISVYSVYICILQQCCIVVIIYDAPSRIFFLLLSKADMDLILLAVLY